MQPRPDSKTVVNFPSALSRYVILLFALSFFFFFLMFEQTQAIIEVLALGGSQVSSIC